MYKSRKVAKLTYGSNSYTCAPRNGQYAVRNRKAALLVSIHSIPDPRHQGNEESEPGTHPRTQSVHTKVPRFQIATVRTTVTVPHDVRGVVLDQSQHHILKQLCPRNVKKEVREFGLFRKRIKIHTRKSHLDRKALKALQ